MRCDVHSQTPNLLQDYAKSRPGVLDMRDVVDDGRNAGLSRKAYCSVNTLSAVLEGIVTASC